VNLGEIFDLVESGASAGTETTRCGPYNDPQFQRERDRAGPQPMTT